MTSRPRSARPCASFRTTRKKSPPSTKSHLSDMPLECLVIYELINRYGESVRPVISDNAVDKIEGIYQNNLPTRNLLIERNCKRRIKTLRNLRQQITP